MKSSASEKLKNRYQKIAPVLPALAFFGGFVWDAITLGIRIKSSDLYIVMGYYFSAAICLVFIGRINSGGIAKYLPLLFQFFLGGEYSVPWLSFILKVQLNFSVI